MRANHGRDTGPELRVRRLVHAAGLRYRVNARPESDVRRTVDMLFSTSRVVVLIDGCFWHDCPDHGSAPKSNVDWWREKLATNVSRDRDTDERLQAAGWTVVRVWEHEQAADAADLIVETLNLKRGMA